VAIFGAGLGGRGARLLCHHQGASVYLPVYPSSHPCICLPVRPAKPCRLSACPSWLHVWKLRIGMITNCEFRPWASCSFGRNPHLPPKQTMVPMRQAFTSGMRFLLMAAKQ
jgi:hypothetical protein